MSLKENRGNCLCHQPKTVFALQVSVTCLAAVDMTFSRFQLLKATTRNPWTRDFRHLLPVPKHFVIKQSFYDPGIKAVRVKDRIKFWNIVPGDRIRIRGDSRSTIHEVLSINRFTNRVYLKGTIKVRFAPTLYTVTYHGCRNQPRARCR